MNEIACRCIYIIQSCFCSEKLTVWCCRLAKKEFRTYCFILDFISIWIGFLHFLNNYGLRSTVHANCLYLYLYTLYPIDCKISQDYKMQTFSSANAWSSIQLEQWRSRNSLRDLIEFFKYSGRFKNQLSFYRNWRFSNRVNWEWKNLRRFCTILLIIQNCISGLESWA